MVTVFTLTPAAAAQALQDHGLDALGLTAPRLSATWGAATPVLDPATLRLTPQGSAQAPWLGVLEYLDSGAAFRDATGAPITGPVGVFRLHPQAVQRIGALAQSRYAMPAQPHHRVLPEALVFSGAVPVPDRSPQTWEAGDTLNRSEPMSFHDHRGLIVDPVAVAAILDDLMTAFPALDASGGAARNGAGGVATIAALATGTLVQVVDLHGSPFMAVPGGPSVEARNGTTVTGTPDASGLLTPAAGETLAGSGGTAAARMRLGWATGGTMGAGLLSLPDLPGGVTLPRQFLRAFATDLDWHILGNRSTATVRGVPAEDGKMPPDLKPQVRDGVSVDYLADGPDLLAEAGRIILRTGGAAGSPLVFAVAPLIADGVGLPPAPGAQAHWPTFPGPDSGTGFAGTASPLPGATAAWTSGVDVVVTLPADAVPNGAALRVFAQRFQLIEAIGEAPSFLRGDGGAAIAVAGQPTQILVANPLGLAVTDPRPSPAVLVFDLVVMPRRGNRRLFANRRLDIGAGPAALPADPFATPDPMAALPPAVKSVCPAPLFGMTRTTSPTSGLTNPIDIVRALGNETEPREGPRHATMGRLEGITLSGIGSAQLQDGLDWDGVLSGGRWTRETRSAALRDGNPGNPAGPDTHVAAVRVTGALGHDLARHAVRRVQPMLPLPGGASATTSPGWIVMSGGNNMNPPTPDPANPPAAGSSCGALLQTVAAIAETPELSLLPAGNPLDSGAPITFDQLLDDIAGALGIPSPSGGITIANEDRLINEVRREYFLARDGARDALWSLARACLEAEELVYIDTPGLARTARPVGTPAAHEIDLIALLAQRLTARPNLKVIIATPREGDLTPAPFARRAFAQRKEAYDLLASAAPGRVAAFHPKGFPGRAAQIRSTCVIVDDVWSLTGATHIRRRGMTFDGSAAVASFDRDIADGYSRKVQAQRVALLAARLGIARLDGDGLPTPEFLRLARPSSAFALIRDLLAQGGGGVVQPLWHGPQDSLVIPQTDDIADPDGSAGAPAGLGLAAFLSEA